MATHSALSSPHLTQRFLIQPSSSPPPPAAKHNRHPPQRLPQRPPTTASHTASQVRDPIRIIPPRRVPRTQQRYSNSMHLMQGARLKRMWHVWLGRIIGAWERANLVVSFVADGCICPAAMRFNGRSMCLYMLWLRFCEWMKSLGRKSSPQGMSY